jgi:[ribosomal protein S5]-alanine N-acetyltransferase
MNSIQCREAVSAPLLPRRATSAELLNPAWRTGLPVLRGRRVVLRDLRLSDAPWLFNLMNTIEVARFIHVPPTSVDAFERFIAYAHDQRAGGLGACFAAALNGFDEAIGIFQIRAVEPDFSVAEWGFALGSAFWGTGVFREGADLILQFAFDTLHVRRLEATAAVRNGRGNRALQKMGAVQEGILRESFFCNGEYLDEAMYAILESDWRASRDLIAPPVTLSVH